MKMLQAAVLQQASWCLFKPRLIPRFLGKDTELCRLCLIFLELGPLLPQEIIPLSKPWAFAPNFSEGS